MKFDAKAKTALAAWPRATSTLWSTPDGVGKWLRAQPNDGAAGPKLLSAGTDAFATQPDGLWVHLLPQRNCADAIAVEACGNRQNFADKRFRYAPSTTAVVVSVPLGWLLAQTATKGGRPLPRWQLSGTFGAAPIADVEFPLRALRVLYFLEDDLYGKWKSQGVPAAHEFIAPYSSVNSVTSQKMQRFLKRMTPFEHFYRS